jgi:RNA polymerase sigma-70 factor (ECF subfamily)
MPPFDSDEAASPMDGVAAGPGSGAFPSTHWSVVLAAQESSSPAARAALEQLCRAYWYPLYAYVRRAGYSIEDAQDLTQEFFARLLAKSYVTLAERDRGKFRSFLLTSLRNHLANEFHHRTRVKRGGDAQLVWLDALAGEARFAAEPVDASTPETLYERRWALMLVENSLARLRKEYHAGGRGPIYELLKDYVWGEKNATTYAEVAAHLDLTEEAVKKAAQRLRHRLRELLREEIGQTVATVSDIDEELRHIVDVLR